MLDVKTGMENPKILPLVPLLYVAWADNVLSPSEIGLIKEKVDSMAFLEVNDRDTVYSWLDPANPPSKELMEAWVSVIRAAAENPMPESQDILLGLARQMASVNDGAIGWEGEEAQQALAEIATAIGEPSLKYHRNLLTEELIREANRQFNAACFVPEAMQQLLEGEEAGRIERLKHLLADPVFALRHHENKEVYRTQVLEWCKLLAAQGYGAIAYPEEYGGKSDMMGYMTIFETLGYHDLSMVIKFGVQFGLFGGSVMWLGTKKHHDKYQKLIGTMELPGCFAMTETGHGSNVRDLETTATYDRATGEFVIHTPHYGAGKEYIGNALHGQMATVFAQLITDGEQHGVHALLVPLRDDSGNHLPGVRVEDCGYKLGLNGVDNGRIWFDQVRVPRENLLDRFGSVDEQGLYSSPIESRSRRFFTMLGTLVGGRVGVPRAGLSAAKKGMAIAVKHALKRRQFGPEGEAETLLLDYPMHQRRLLPLLARTYAMHFGLQYLTKRFVNRTEDDIREIETLAAAMKSWSTWQTTRILQECREACGGKGYLWENAFADLKADTDIFTTFEGDNSILMQLVSKGLLTEYKREFNDMNPIKLVRYLLGEVAFSVEERRGSRNVDEEHLRDDEYHLDVVRHRERHLLKSLGKRLRAYIKSGMDSYDAAIRCQTHLLALGKAYADRVMLEQFVLALKACEDESLHKVLDMLCDLFALHIIEENKAWYLEHEYLSPKKSRAIRKTIDKLCMKLRPEAGCLVDAFGIPDYLLFAQIAVGGSKQQHPEKVT